MPLTLADEYWGDPAISSIKYPSDVHLTKPSTDVILVGRAWVPQGQQATQLDARLVVAEREATVRVIGNRVWHNGSATPPEPFSSMPIVYEYAFGGTHTVDPNKPEILAEERNPIGRGFRGKRGTKELEGLPLPNIEAPQCPVDKYGDKAWPAGFASIAPSWLHRRSFAGTYDDTWKKERAPYLPYDFNPRFFNIAHPNFIYDRYLHGGEPVTLDNLSRHGQLRFNLPLCNLQAEVSVAGQIEAPPLNLETILIEPEADRLCMTWRGAVTCDKKALKIEQVDVRLLDLNLEGSTF